MRKRFVGFWSRPASEETKALLFLSFFFLCGVLIGSILASRISGGGDDALATYIEGYLLAVDGGAAVSANLLALIWDIFRFPIFAVLFGFTILGILGIPVLLAVRGFLLSFAVTSFVKMLGGRGLLLAFCMLGIPALITLPCLLMLSSHAFLSAGRLTLRASSGERTGGKIEKRYLSRVGGCVAALVFCTLLEYFAIPYILTLITPAF